MQRTSRRLWLGLSVLLAVSTTLPAQQNAPAQDKPKAVVIRFFANIDPGSVGALLQTVDAQYKAGVGRFIILMSSPGGDILSGFMAYNYLKGYQ
jgi:membrane-bound ClpP family serine protease